MEISRFYKYLVNVDLAYGDFCVPISSPFLWISLCITTYLTEFYVYFNTINRLKSSSLMEYTEPLEL